MMASNIINNKSRVHQMLCVASGAKLRYFMLGNEPVFLASDVCKALCFGKIQIVMDCLKTSESTMARIDGFINLQYVVNQSGLWQLMIMSKERLGRPHNVKLFERWLESNVFTIVRPFPDVFNPKLVNRGVEFENKERKLADIVRAVESSPSSVVDAVHQLLMC